MMVDPPPSIIIVGAGLGGLALAALLEHIDVTYVILERLAEVKTNGAALFISPAAANLLRQLGIYDEVKQKSKPCNSIDLFTEKRKPLFVLDFADFATMSGAEGFIIPRSSLYEILLELIPPEKILRGKRVLSFVQGEGGVQVKCADGSVHESDILVGADGAYSAVRQNLYERLKKEGKLSVADQKPAMFNCVCLTAQTYPLDPVQFPELSEPGCHYNNIVAQNKPYSWMTFTGKDNIVCWSVIQYLNKETSELNDTFRSTDWGSGLAEAMCREVQHFPIPGGNGKLTLADLIVNTPRDQIAKVTLEEKVFESWYGGRTVLLGNAVHKFHPAGGEGPLCSLYDAVSLANWINVLETNTIAGLDAIFKEYVDERLPPARAALIHARNMANMYSRTFKASMARFVSRNMPDFLWKTKLAKSAADRAQAAFLPLIQDSGTVPPLFQPSLYKTLAILEAQAAAKKAKEDAAATSTTISTASTASSGISGISGVSGATTATTAPMCTHQTYLEYQNNQQQQKHHGSGVSSSSASSIHNLPPAPFAPTLSSSSTSSLSAHVHTPQHQQHHYSASFPGVQQSSSSSAVVSPYGASTTARAVPL
ncbi:hypothetical protein BGZ91_008710 [Linnemannia elongata]|nr:hypothetical protein BGZ91_008710 [Linnemannia elongata]KAG0061161.1 hypothetical protein BGZ90_003691 [Linnemannia elongata]